MTKYAFNHGWAASHSLLCSASAAGNGLVPNRRACRANTQKVSSAKLGPGDGRRMDLVETGAAI